MRAVAEPAAQRELGDVGERRLDGVGIGDDPDRPQPGRVDEHRAARQLHELSVGRRVSPAPIGAPVADHHRLDSRERVHECGLARPGRPDDDERRPGGKDRAQRLQPGVGGRADRVHVDPRRGARHLGGQSRALEHEVHLGEHHDRAGAGSPGEREQALDAAEVRVWGEVLDDEHDIDVRRERLRARRPVCGVPHELGPARQQLGQAGDAVRPGADDDVVADRWRPALPRGVGDEAVPIEADAHGSSAIRAGVGSGRGRLRHDEHRAAIDARDPHPVVGHPSDARTPARRLATHFSTRESWVRRRQARGDAGGRASRRRAGRTPLPRSRRGP